VGPGVRFAMLLRGLQRMSGLKAGCGNGDPPLQARRCGRLPEMVRWHLSARIGPGHDTHGRVMLSMSIVSDSGFGMQHSACRSEKAARVVSRLSPALGLHLFLFCLCGLRAPAGHATPAPPMEGRQPGNPHHLANLRYNRLAWQMNIHQSSRSAARLRRRAAQSAAWPSAAYAAIYRRWALRA
jgi:hypothetical protein